MGSTRSYREHLLESLKDMDEAAAYINAALEDTDPHMFLMALRDVAEAQGGMSRLARLSDINRESLYRTLSARGNPRFTNLRAVLDAIGFDLTVDPRPSKQRRSSSAQSRRRPRAG